jgi:hypothetical protein
MASPDFLVCLNCESPCYVFEWEENEITEALCQTCGNDNPEEFATPEEFDALSNE